VRTKLKKKQKLTFEVFWLRHLCESNTLSYIMLLLII